MKYNLHIKGSIGGRKEQQDFAGSVVTSLGLLVVVCDGMGGARGGAIASRMAAEIVIGELSNAKQTSPAAALTAAIQKANAEIYRKSQTDENCRGMGTTLTALILQDDKATLAHVGDSRIYQLRYDQLFSNTPQIVFRTFDHSKVFELVRRGIMTEEQARVSDESNIILRALGIRPAVEIEIKDNVPYLKGDRFMLCTDGICGALPENQLLNLLSTKAEPKLMLNKLVSEVDKLGAKAGGGHDNLTAAIIECQQNSTLKTPLPMQSKLIMLGLGILLAAALGYIGYDAYQRSITKKDTEETIAKLKNDLQLSKEHEKLQQDSIDKLIGKGTQTTSKHTGGSNNTGRMPRSGSAAGSSILGNGKDPLPKPNAKPVAGDGEKKHNLDKDLRGAEGTQSPSQQPATQPQTPETQQAEPSSEEQQTNPPSLPNKQKQKQPVKRTPRRPSAHTGASHVQEGALPLTYIK